MQICSIIYLFAQQRNRFQRAKTHGWERAEGQGQGPRFIPTWYSVKCFGISEKINLMMSVRSQDTDTGVLKEACFSICLKGVEVPQAQSSQKNEM